MSETTMIRQAFRRWCEANFEDYDAVADKRYAVLVDGDLVGGANSSKEIVSCVAKGVSDVEMHGRTASETIAIDLSESDPKRSVLLISERRTYELVEGHRFNPVDFIDSLPAHLVGQESLL